jgi:hypothetical protein
MTPFLNSMYPCPFGCKQYDDETVLKYSELYDKNVTVVNSFKLVLTELTECNSFKTA